MIDNKVLAMSLANSVHKEITRCGDEVLLSVQMTEEVLKHIVALLRSEVGQRRRG